MKRGTASDVANLIAMIVLFMVLYIVILPTPERENLVNNVDSTGSSDYNQDSGSRDSFKVLLSESPGFVYPYIRDVLAQPLPSINLFANQETKETLLANSVYSRRTLFYNSQKEVYFNLEDAESVEDAKLYFSISDGSGKLRIKLNGAEIFNSRITNSDLPIILPKPYLRKNNVLVFEAENPSWKFLTSNYYQLQDLRLFVKYNVENKREKRNFVLSEAEYKNIEGATVFYFVNCLKVKETGTFTIFLNGRMVSQRLVVCDAGEVGDDIDMTYLLQGSNTLEFQIDKGQYVVEQLLLEKRVSQKNYPNYFFSAQREDIIDLEDGLLFGTLELKFSDDGYKKSATILVNGVRIYMETYAPDFIYDISDYLIEGQNFLKIIPNTEFEIEDMEVFLER
ncbi:MAG TPA: hypothetical protein VJB94_02935 [Candidatus Nanoarchaeia archaeon]|nr:hypothetical protein [Candidatus Nanoarchaeia archaeon]